MISAQEIKKLRKKTGAPVMECREALLKAGGDEKKAFQYLKEKGADALKKRASREAKQGRIESYIHSGSRIGAILDLRSETDFVARTKDFKDLSKKLVMQVASMSPKDKKELLGQPLIFDEKMMVKDLINEIAVKTGEKIEIKRFKRFEVGEE
jgi:elongation factor Ts